MRSLVRRAVPWSTLAIGVAPAAVALVVAFGFHERGWAGQLVQVGLLMLAVPASFVLDEATAATVEATPRSPWWILAARASALLALLVATAAVVLAWGALVPTPEIAALALTPAGVVLLAAAGAALMRRAGRATPGDVVAGAMGFAVLGIWLFGPEWRGISALPAPGAVDGRDVVAWLSVMAAAAVAAVWASTSRGARPAVDT